MPHLTASRFNKYWGHLLEEIQYLVKIVSTKTKCTTFDELSITYKSTTIKGHLYRCFFNIQEQNSIFNKTGSHANLCNPLWGIDGYVRFRQDKMLLSKLQHYILRYRCKSKCTKQYKCKKMK